MTKRNIGILITVFMLVTVGVFLSRKLQELNFERHYSSVYENKPLGYKFGTDEEMEVDSSKSEIFTKFENSELEITIYYDDLKRLGGVTKVEYDGYGNEGIRSSKLFSLDKEHSVKVDGISSKVLEYSREKLSKVENDKNHYTTVSVPRTDKEIYTIAVKSKSKDIDLNKILKGFKFTEREGKLEAFKSKSLIGSRQFNEDTRAFVDRYLLKKGQQSFGIYYPSVETWDKAADFTGLEELEQKLQYRFPAVLSYSTNTVFQDGFGELKQNFFAAAKEQGRVPELTFSTFEGGPDISTQDEKTLDILNGKYDSVFEEYAEGFKEFGMPVLFRLNNEMNGDWVSYSSYHMGKDPELYVETYRYIHDFFEARGVDNLIYVFNPNEKSFPDFSYNSYLAYYPGDEYVDVVGLTAYNTGNYYEGEIWRSFDEAYKDLYADYSKRFDQPLIITEFSSASTGGDKVKWFNDMFKSIKDYDRIKLAVLWNGTDWDMKDGKNIPAREYRIDENDEVIEAVRDGLQNFK
ncbi:endoglucanase H precursor [Andreesenia angusta]|uniref:Endoglucanase H n=1 Tax=Andreesenia angusta TaxID=39480 RepID=A0A1S1V6A2_9FIRM|nr:glycosyl hydrolase [Andreesenia angusta]OHW62072.1 endoglucanase H precursor [Andreesenia angusta]